MIEVSSAAYIVTTTASLSHKHRTHADRVQTADTPHASLLPSLLTTGRALTKPRQLDTSTSFALSQEPGAFWPDPDCLTHLTPYSCLTIFGAHAEQAPRGVAKRRREARRTRPRLSRRRWPSLSARPRLSETRRSPRSAAYLLLRKLSRRKSTPQWSARRTRCVRAWCLDFSSFGLAWLGLVWLFFTRIVYPASVIGYMLWALSRRFAPPVTCMLSMFHTPLASPKHITFPTLCRRSCLNTKSGRARLPRLMVLRIKSM